MIEVKNEHELQLMRNAGKVTAAVLKKMTETVEPGMSTLDLDVIAEKTIRSFGAVPLFLGYGGFPGSICASINEEVVHGIPKKDRILKSGDIISIDTGAKLDGFCSDAAITLGVGKVSDEAQRLMDVTKKSLYKAIAKSNRVSDWEISETRWKRMPSNKAWASSAITAGTASAATCTRSPLFRTSAKRAPVLCWRRAWCLPLNP